jgi:hypothetical protein
MQIHAVMKCWHPMIGRDLHVPWVPGTPAPAPSPVPYFTYHIMLGFGVVCSVAPTHNSMGWGWTMQKGTDIGFLIPHIGPPSLLTPLDMILSASKSYFGASAYMAEGKPVACALLGMTNPNLNCGSPMPFSIGQVIALNTHFVSMTLGDFLHGLLSFGIDFALQCAIGWLVGKGADKIANRIAPTVMSKQAAKQLLRSQGVKNKVINTAARAFVDARNARIAKFLPYLPHFLRVPQAVNPVVNGAVSNVIGFFVGGPMGADAGLFGAPTPGGGSTSCAQKYLDNTGIQDIGGPPGQDTRPSPNSWDPRDVCKSDD